jgi:hypothetical protein
LIPLRRALIPPAPISSITELAVPLLCFPGDPDQEICHVVIRQIGEPFGRRLRVKHDFEPLIPIHVAPQPPRPFGPPNSLLIAGAAVEMFTRST